jgi:flavin-dependent dehydrogenase
MDRVRILGAGPAGLSAAITLAGAGYDVDVFEGRGDVGTRFHGDLQGLENWSNEKDILEDFRAMGVRTDFEYAPYRDLSVSNGREMLNFSCGRPAFYLVRRGALAGSLDTALKDQALDAGAEIHFSTRRAEEDADIVATGPVKDGLLALAKGFTFTTSMENTAVGIIDLTASRKGYAYLLAMNGRGCIATVLMDDFQDAGACLDRARALFSGMMDLDIRDPAPYGGVGSFRTTTRYRDGGRLYVGEAAGLQDPMWGFGMRFAVRSGHLAARSIIEGTDYERAATEAFGDLIRAGTVNRYLWDRYAVKDYSFLFERLKGVKDPLKHLGSFHSFNVYQKLLYPRARRYLNAHYEKGKERPSPQVIR